MNSFIEFNEENLMVEKDNRVVLLNKINLNKIKIPKETYEILKSIEENKIEKDELKSCFDLESDYVYISNLIKKMTESELLIDEQTKPNLNLIKWEVATLILTKNCNLSCIHCCQNADFGSCEDDLITEKMFELIDKLSEISSLHTIILSGGEPLLRKDFEDIVSYIKSKGLKLLLMSNGLLINESNVKFIVDNFESISISIDGIDEELSNFIRGKNVFNKVISKIKLLKKNKCKNLSLSAILPQNLDIEKEFKELCKKLDVIPEMRKFSGIGRGLSNYNLIIDKYNEYILKKGYSKENEELFKEVIYSKNKCGACNSLITIDFNGDIYPCNILQEDKFNLGNLFSIEDIGEYLKSSKKVKKIMEFKEFKTKECNNCKFTDICWSCLASIEEYINLNTFSERCDKRKKDITEQLFGRE